MSVLSKLSFTAVLSAALAAGADTLPSVVDVQVSAPDSVTRKVEITYTLLDGPAIVTVQLATNNVPLPDSAHAYLDGDVDTLVTNTACKISWDSRHAWPRQKLDGVLSATLTVYPLFNPPLYCAVDLTGGTNAAAYPLEFYVSSNAVPGGVQDERYKRRKLLLRKISRTGGQGFAMGSPFLEYGRDSSREQQHTVVLTRDYYMGVYEVTQEQWWRVMGNGYLANWRTGAPAGYSKLCPTKPMENIAYTLIRGTKEQGIDWPGTTNTVATSSFMGKLRVKTGNTLAFDLPSEAQWEYACRAGTYGAWCNGMSATNWVISNPNLDLLAWYNHPAEGSTYVGSFLPNAWGLYDMHGNVTEWCCDWLEADNNLPDGVDPMGPNAGRYRIGRGGNYANNAIGLRSASRPGNTATQGFPHYGFRLSATIQPVWNP